MILSLVTSHITISSCQLYALFAPPPPTQSPRMGPRPEAGIYFKRRNWGWGSSPPWPPRRAGATALLLPPMILWMVSYYHTPIVKTWDWCQVDINLTKSVLNRTSHTGGHFWNYFTDILSSCLSHCMMTSWHGNSFCITGPLWGESAMTAELQWCKEGDKVPVW